MKTYTVELTVVIRVEVPDRDGCPINVSSLRRIIDWQANRYSDGRYPATTEQIMFWALREVQHGVHETIFQGVCDRNRYRGNMYLDERNRVIAKLGEGINVYPSNDGGKLIVSVREGSDDFNILPYDAKLCADGPKPLCRGSATQSFYGSLVQGEENVAENVVRVKQIYMGSMGIWKECTHRSDWTLKADPQARVHVNGVAVCAENHDVRHLRGKAFVALDKGVVPTVELDTFLERFDGAPGAKEDLDVAVAELRRSIAEQNR